MTVTVRRMGDGDLVWAAELLTRYSAARLSAAERTAGGFVQGSFTPEKIAAHVSGAAGYVAEVDGRHAGVLLTSRPGSARQGPPAALDAAARARFGADGYLLYGPVVVDGAFRGRGVLRSLAAHLTAAGTGFSVAVAFIEAVNTVSLAAHERIGLETFDEFTIGQRRYLALALPLPDALPDALPDTAAAPPIRRREVRGIVAPGRTCHRHLAGRLGVALSEQLVAGGHLTAEALGAGGTLTVSGRELFSSWGVAGADRATGHGCLDGTERRPHLAGPIGVLLCRGLFANGWVTRIDDSRAARVTAAGAAALAAAGISIPPDAVIAPAP